jgi:UDP-N-acetylmuramate dehydrogenase
MNKRDFYQSVFKDISGKMLDEEMKEHTSMRVGGRADILLSPSDVEEIREILALVRKNEIPLFVLGEGTNVIVRDNGIRGAVVSMKSFRDTRVLESSDRTAVKAGAGLNLSALMNLCVKEGFSGMEDGAGIPGSLGGAVMMNAGAKSWEMKDSVTSVTVINDAGEVFPVPKKDIQFEYRSARLPQKGIVLEVVLSFRKEDRGVIQGRFRSNMEQRRKTQPLSFPSAGSIFKNPEGLPAGRIIDDLGLKGYSIGGAKVSELHANFIVNKGEATAEDIIHLIEHIEKTVYQETGIILEREVCIIGE